MDVRRPVDTPVTALAQAEPAVALLPDSILTSLSVEKPRGIVAVKGTVTRLTPFPAANPKWIYGDLQGQESAITFRCALGNAPAIVGERAVLAGILKVEPSRIHNGLEVRLEGEKVGTWTPSQPDSTNPVQLETARGRVSLRDFVRNMGIGKLLIVGSARALSDLITEFGKHGTYRGWQEGTASFGDAKSLLSDVEDLVKRHRPAGIAFARGGSDARSLSFWDEPNFVYELIRLEIPFYTAIGHSDRLLLADKYADEAFATPSIFGGSLAASLWELQREQGFVRRVMRLERERRILLIVAGILLIAMLTMWLK